MRIHRDVSFGEGSDGRGLGGRNSGISLQLHSLSSGLWTGTVWTSHAVLVCSADQGGKAPARGILRNYYIWSVFFADTHWVWRAGHGSRLDFVAELAAEREGRAGEILRFAAVGRICAPSPGENWRLLGQLLGSGTEFVSHKADYVLEGSPFLETLRHSFFYGEQHSEGYHLLLLAYTLFAAALGWAGLRGEKTGDSGSCRKIYSLLRIIGFCFGWNLLFAITAGIWRSGWGVELRSRLSFLGAFQLDRVLWIAPCLWYLAAACAAGIVCTLGRRRHGYRFALAPMTVLAALTAVWTLYSGDFKTNMQKLRNPDYGMLSYRDYYALGVMEQAREFLDTYSQKNAEEYRVVSLGIDPAAALYHGFCCLDGYSNNYSLEYKKKFREIIAPELDRNDYLKQYFDNWGNRCYLFSSECPGYYTIEKNGFSFQDYRIDAKALYELGGRYLLSAAYIQNAEEQGLLLLNETPFETPDSYYRIFIYEVVPGN